MARVSVSNVLNALVELGRQYLDRPSPGAAAESVVAMCHELVSVHGEASGTALASEIMSAYRSLDEEARLDALGRINAEFAIDEARLVEAARTYAGAPGEGNFRSLAAAIESPRQELFRRINMGPGGTAAIVAMRELLLAHMRDRADLAPLEQDLRHLLSSWFNRGFLQFERIDWRTPANILEKLIDYEAVHEITGWEDLRRRLAEDRRCFAFFHPALPDEPLIFVEVALTHGLAGQVQALLEETDKEAGSSKPDTAIFYSISNCQAGLAGISFGNFLIKQVADAVQRELPHIKRFATLSPIPGFRRWLDEQMGRAPPEFLGEDDVEMLRDGRWRDNEIAREELKPALMRLCASYLIEAKRGDRPADPVARFHLGNGARVERLNWAADLSGKGLDQSAGMMVNYLYDSGEIVSNHEAYVRYGVIAASSGITRLAAGRS